VKVFATIVAAFSIAATPSPVVRSFHLPRGPSITRFRFQVHAPAFFAVRLSVPVGANIHVVARDRMRIAQVGTGTGGFWAAHCSRHGRNEVCESFIEGCPAPQGRWDAVLVKRSRDPAPARVTFLFNSKSG
jgi:hypothetical protein